MFVRHKTRHKDGKTHRYWSIVENRRVRGGRTMQRHVLYLGEINDSQRAAWCQTTQAFDEASGHARQIALFPEDRTAPALDCDVVHVRLSELRLRRPRQWGACWLASELWNQLQLDEFWSARLPPSRQGTRWLNVLKNPGGLSADRSRQRVAAAPAVVRTDCDERHARRGFRSGRRTSCTAAWTN
jgi:hypothetical protein